MSGVQGSTVDAQHTGGRAGTTEGTWNREHHDERVDRKENVRSMREKAECEGKGL